jgi:hypothetical protein
VPAELLGDLEDKLLLLVAHALDKPGQLGQGVASEGEDL